MIKVQVVDWSDDAYRRVKKSTGTISSEVVAEVEVSQFSGFCFDGGRLDIAGHPETIWITSHQWSLNIIQEQSNVQ